VKYCRVLTLIVLAGSLLSFGSAPNNNAGSGARETFNPRLDIPKNCKAVTQPDDSVELTCECPACGKPDAPRAARGNPARDPWTCRSRAGGLYCSYDLDPVTPAERQHSHI
jgi:hypothetical protein